MANALYTKGKQKFLEGFVNLKIDDIQVTLVDGALYTPTIATDNDIAEIPVAARIANTGLTSKTTTDGVFDAADITFPVVPSNANSMAYLVIWRNSGTEANSQLLAVFDTATGLPVTPNGGDINITWSAGAAKIFSLS